MRKKILIISKDSLETSTEKVIDWINHLEHDFYRLNGDIFELTEKSIMIESYTKLNLKIDNKKILKNYYSIWVRRWSDSISGQLLLNKGKYLNLDPKLIINLTACFSQDIATTCSIVLNMFKCKKYLTNIGLLNVNKLIILNEAKKHKLEVPEFLLTNRKKHLLAFHTRKKIILKDLDEPFTYQSDNVMYASYGELLSLNAINKFPDIFFLSFFQEYIDKDYEIRSFFLNNKIYSMAIFSQRDERTKIDLRRHNNKNINRTVPYQLPYDIEKKLIKFMNSLKLKTGSIDILKSINGKYYFLEVNPVGQFGMVSGPCNYNIEFEIAKYLVS